MESYACECCGYITDRKYNLQLHLASKKHKYLELDKQSQNNSNSYNKYNLLIQKDLEIQLLKEQLITQKTQDEIQLLKEQLNSKDALLKEQNKHNNAFLKEQNKHNNALLEEKDKHNKYLQSALNNESEITKSSINTLNSSMSTLNFVITNFKKTPQLKKIEYDDAKKLLEQELDDTINLLKKEFESTGKKFTDEEKNEIIIDKLISMHNKKIIAKLICKLITSEYKTADPHDQSFWNSDSSRLHYLIREIVGSKAEWITDKKGSKLANYVIKPIIKLFESLIVDYSKNCFKIVQKYDCSASTSEKYMEQLAKVEDLQLYLRSKTICSDVCSELSPEFHLDKNKLSKILLDTDNISLSIESKQIKKSKTKN